MSINPTFQAFPIDALRVLVETDADILRRNKRQARALLNDEFPGYGLQVEVLAAALETDVPSSLTSASERRTLAIESGRLAQNLVSRFGFQEYMARWSVAAWAFALGLGDEKAVSSTLTIDQPTAGGETVGASGLSAGTIDRVEIASPPAAIDGGVAPPPPPGQAQQPPSGGSRPPHTSIRVSRNAIIIAALLAALIIVASVAGVAMATNAFGPQPTATPIPTPTATPTPVPTATPTPLPTISPAAVESHDVNTIANHGYRAKTQIPEFAFTPNGSGGTLYAWAGTCANSGDGYCAKVFFFNGKTFLGTDTSGNSPAINSVESAGPKVIDVTYANYKSSDPNCCPSGVPVTISYTWNGSTMTASGTPPGH
jgi:hypothetical protein